MAAFDISACCRSQAKGGRKTDRQILGKRWFHSFSNIQLAVCLAETKGLVPAPSQAPNCLPSKRRKWVQPSRLNSLANELKIEWKSQKLTQWFYAIFGHESPVSRGLNGNPWGWETKEFVFLLFFLFFRRQQMALSASGKEFFQSSQILSPLPFPARSLTAGSSWPTSSVIPGTRKPSDAAFLSRLWPTSNTTVSARKHHDGSARDSNQRGKK